MTAPEPFDPLDPFSVHFHREPLEGAGVALVLLSDSAEGSVEAVFGPCVAWLQSQNREAETRVVTVDGADPRLNERIGEVLDTLSLPIVMLCAAVEPLSPEHLKPLLKAIDHADHVVGRRPAGPAVEAARWVARLSRRLVFAVPVLDVYSPCRLHRADKLREIPLQSGSSFVDVEILAKATFLGHLLDEVAVPPLGGRVWRRGWLRNLGSVFKRPTFRRPKGVESESGPLEEAESQPERADRPGDENAESQKHLESPDTRPFENNHPQGADELGQG